jgi:tetratricopeptide (TPR) repeat protein
MGSLGKVEPDREVVLATAARLVERRSYEQAILEYRKLVDADAQDARTLLKIGDLQCRLGAFAEAIPTYIRAADMYVAQRHPLKAIATYAKARELVLAEAPELEVRYAHLAFAIVELYRELGLNGDALAILSEVARRFESSGNERDAIPVLRSATELEPESSALRLRLAAALSRVGDDDAAATELSIAASQLVATGRTDDALGVIERILLHKPDPIFARLAARLYLARGTRPDAIYALRKLQLCVRADAMDVEALRMLANAFAAIGQHEKASAVEKELAAIQISRGMPVITALPAPAAALGPLPENERDAIHMVPVPADVWNALAARLSEHGSESGESEQVIAFVCAAGDDERNTMRTIYGVVKTVFG